MTAKEMMAVLSERGLRPTHQRIAVYDYLQRHATHPTADTIYAALRRQNPTLSRTTIYNCLHSLVESGLVRVVRTDAEEQRFDGCVEDHGHFQCRCCREVFDFPIDAAAARAMCPTDFLAGETDVYVMGVCPACQAANDHASA